MLLSYADRCCHQNAMYKPDAESEPVKTKELGGWAEYALGLETQVGLMPSNICLRLERGAHLRVLGDVLLRAVLAGHHVDDVLPAESSGG